MPPATPRPSWRETLHAATTRLAQADPILRPVIARAGPCRLKRRRRNHYRTLVGSIISQQISGKAAKSISARLVALVDDDVSPERIARLKDPQLRGVGISPQKAGYIRDLTEKVLSGAVPLAKLARQPDEEVIAELTQVKGIGVWTAQMFLIFSLGRLDVFPHDDLGVRSALARLYSLKELPDKTTSHAIAAAWRPYATLGSWYCWRSLEFSAAE